MLDSLQATSDLLYTLTLIGTQEADFVSKQKKISFYQNF
jgi:hypothetical protein